MNVPIAQLCPNNEESLRAQRSCKTEIANKLCEYTVRSTLTRSAKIAGCMDVPIAQLRPNKEEGLWAQRSCKTGIAGLYIV